MSNSAECSKDAAKMSLTLEADKTEGRRLADSTAAQRRRNA